MMVTSGMQCQLIMRHLHAVSDTEDDDVLDHIREETTGDWCETWNKVLYEWQVNCSA